MRRAPARTRCVAASARDAIDAARMSTSHRRAEDDARASRERRRARPRRTRVFAIIVFYLRGALFSPHRSRGRRTSARTTKERSLRAFGADAVTRAAPRVNAEVMETVMAAIATAMCVQV